MIGRCTVWILARTLAVLTELSTAFLSPFSQGIRWLGHEHFLANHFQFTCHTVHTLQHCMINQWKSKLLTVFSNNISTYPYLNEKAKVLSGLALSTCLEGIWGVDAYLHTLLTLEMDVSASHPSCLTHRVKTIDTYWTGGLGSSKTNVNALQMR